MANTGKSSSRISENLLDAFELLADVKIDSARFDKTILGIILSCEDENTGKYKVQYQNSIFEAYSSALDVKYSKGTSVHIKVPNNDFSDRKIIIGTASEGGIEYEDIIEDPLMRYENIGHNCLTTSGELGISSYWPVNSHYTEKEIYSRGGSSNLVEVDEDLIKESLKQSNSIILGAHIKTNLPIEQKINGNYGIIFYIRCKNKTTGSTTTRQYIVDINNMEGDPYNYTDGTTQLIPFDFDPEEYVYIQWIDLFAENFPLQDTSAEPDIFFSNLCFQPAKKLDEIDNLDTALQVIIPQGNYFNDTEQITIKEAIAQVRIRGKITQDYSNKIQYYWFAEDLSVNTTNNIYYSKYGGRGWKCLNAYNVTSEDENENPKTVEFITTDSTFKIRKDFSRARHIKYKCVAVYNKTTLVKEFEFTNYSSDIDVYISYDRDPNFINSIGATTLTCFPEDNNYTYVWVKIDSAGGFTRQNNNTSYNNRYNTAVANKEQLLLDIANKVKPDNDTTRAQLATYDRTIATYSRRTRVENNNIWNLQAGDVVGTCYYKCQVFDENNISLGVATQKVTNTTTGQAIDANLLIINGNQIFKYNTEGLAPTNTTFSDPQVVLPLEFILRTDEGIEVPATAIKDEDVLWKVPIDKSLIKIPSTLDPLVVEEGEGYRVYKGKTLGYNISDNYYMNKDNNEIELQVKYNGIIYTATTSLYFVKDGMNGTNGTGYVLTLIPQDTIGELKTVYSGTTDTRWFLARLSYNGTEIFYNDHNENDVTIEWSLVGDRRSTHNISVISNGAASPTWSVSPTFNSEATDIVKATVTYQGLTITATAPVIYEYFINGANAQQYKLSLKKNTGYTHVVYSEDGKTPSYDSNTPFEIAIQKYIVDGYGDLTGHPSLQYLWSCTDHLKLKHGYTNYDTIVMFEPVGDFEGDITNHAVNCTVYEDDVAIAQLHIPIHFLLNTYGHSAINDWDGNSIQLDANGNTMLLAPQAGFGEKDTNTNTYSGLLLGAIKDYTTTPVKKERGLFGYYQGQRTIFLNSDNGSATFGRTGGAQIIIDPSQSDKALITSGNYSTTAGTGMEIDLSTPSIRYGSGKFSVDANGILHASDVIVNGQITAGTGSRLGNWYIGTAIYNGRTSYDSRTAGTYIGTDGISAGYTYLDDTGNFQTRNAYGIKTMELTDSSLTFYYSSYNTNPTKSMKLDANNLTTYFSNGNVAFQVDGNGLETKYSNNNYKLRVTDNGLYSYASNGNNRFSVTDYGLSLFDSSSNQTLMVSDSGGLHLYKNGSPCIHYTTTGWQGISGSNGAAINLDPGADFISFGKLNSTRDAYTTSFLVNQGLNPEGDTCGVILFGDTSVHGNIRFKANGSVVNTPYICGSSNSNTLLLCGDIQVQGDFDVTGSKNRLVQTDNFGTVTLSAYETPSPLFGDIGQGQCDENGDCYIYLDEIFKETIQIKKQYYVFLQGIQGDVTLWEQEPEYFIVKGKPNQKFNFEIKASQRGVHDIRFKSQSLGEEPNEMLMEVQND